MCYWIMREKYMITVTLICWFSCRVSLIIDMSFTFCVYCNLIVIMCVYYTWDTLIYSVNDRVYT